MPTEHPSNWTINRVALLSTGSEILQGQYADTNARFLAETLTLSGLAVTTIIAAPDDPNAIERALRFAAANADLVICTGGLGPTLDDVNRFVFEQVFNRTLLRDEQAMHEMERRFQTRAQGPMPEANNVQALLPEGCIPFYNQWGTAPGFLIPPTGKGDLPHCALLALPGPPSEMMPMFTELVMPALQKHLPAGRLGGIRTLHTYGHAESYVGALVADLFQPATGVEFSILAKRHGVDLRICAVGTSKAQVDERLTEYENLVRARLHPGMIYGLDDDTLAKAVGELLKNQKAWVTTAESCTGGMVAQMLTEVAGSSAYVGECHVTYSDEAKIRVLGVKPKTLKLFGAVSEQTAIEMAEGARRVSGADYAISITGIAGPDGGTPEKPVGLVYIAIAGPGGTKTGRNQYLADRDGIRLHSAQTSLNMLRLVLLSDIDNSPIT